MSNCFALISMLAHATKQLAKDLQLYDYPSLVIIGSGQQSVEARHRVTFKRRRIHYLKTYSSTPTLALSISLLLEFLTLSVPLTRTVPSISSHLHFSPPSPLRPHRPPSPQDSLPSPSAAKARRKRRRHPRSHRRLLFSPAKTMTHPPTYGTRSCARSAGRRHPRGL